MKNHVSVIKILKSTVSGWLEDDPFRQSAVIAYYAIFSLPALLVLIINVLGFFMKQETISAEIGRQVSGVMGADTAQQVGKIVENANHIKAGLLPGIIAVLILISGATGVFVQLQIALNTVWGVKQKPNAGIMQTIRTRVFSFGLILAIGFLLLVSLVVSSVLASVSHWLEGALSTSMAFLVYAIDLVVSLGVISVLFALMFKYLPDVKMSWRNVWAGAIMTGFLFILGKYGLSLYFGKAHPGSVYGAAGSIILILLWVSYSSMIIFFGAEFTKQYAVASGAEIVAAPNAEVIEHHAVKPAPEAKHKEPRHATDHEPHLATAKALDAEMDKKELHLLIKKIQIKDRIAGLFRFGKRLQLQRKH